MMFRIMVSFALSIVVAAPVTLAQDLALLWPNADGTRWTYDQHHEDFLTTETVENTVRLFLQGTVAIPGGPVVQSLHEELVEGTPKAQSTATPRIHDRLLQQLWQARPDLRTRIAACAAVQSPGSVQTQPYIQTILVGAGTFEKTVDQIRAWRTDISGQVSWLWLVADLTPGNTFQLQLVPDLADDVFLFGTIGTVEEVAVPAGVFGNAQRVEYRIDFGVSTCIDDMGNTVGEFRSETSGSIHFVRAVGPVRVDEDFFILSEQVSGDCFMPPVEEGQVTTRTSLALSSSDVVPVKSTSWGAVKTIYRDR
jgi:hypothetical protein